MPPSDSSVSERAGAASSRPAASAASGVRPRGILMPDVRYGGAIPFGAGMERRGVYVNGGIEGAGSGRPREPVNAARRLDFRLLAALTAICAVNAAGLANSCRCAAFTRGNAGPPRGYAGRPALTADIAVNAGQPPDPRGRPALTGRPPDLPS